MNRSYALCFILYFLQGNVISIGQTMPYLYKELPSYKTLALFSTIDLPFSFKFILCTDRNTQRPSSRSTPTSPMANARRGSSSAKPSARLFLLSARSSLRLRWPRSSPCCLWARNCFSPSRTSRSIACPSKKPGQLKKPVSYNLSLSPSEQSSAVWSS